MSEAETVLRFAFFIHKSTAVKDNIVRVSIDGACNQVFPVQPFLETNGYMLREALAGSSAQYTGQYVKGEKIIQVFASDYREKKPDLEAILSDGRRLVAECKKGRNQVDSVMHQAIGQFITSGGFENADIRVIVLPYSEKVVSLARNWLSKAHIQALGICIAAVNRNEETCWVPSNPLRQHLPGPVAHGLPTR